MKKLTIMLMSFVLIVSLGGCQKSENDMTNHSDQVQDTDQWDEMNWDAGKWN